MKLQIAILGTRGIPNQYGGYEQVVSFLAPGLVQRGHRVTVYNSHNHPYKEAEWKGVEIVRRYDPEYAAGSAGQFIYDLNCIRHARTRNYDVLLMMGYTSSSLWGRFYPKKTVIISNMDGLEWKRSKYSRPVQRYLRYAEKLAVKYSHFYIADSLGIQAYLSEKYKITSQYIPYGAEILSNEDTGLLSQYDIEPYQYCMLMARMEPENNIEMILEGFMANNTNNRFVVVGNMSNKYGKQILKKFNNDRIRYAGFISDQRILHTLRKFSSVYFHGHSVGGTNPSLLEAMASSAQIAAHDNPFNRYITGADAFYFTTAAGVRDIIDTAQTGEKRAEMTGNNLEKIRKYYNWETIIGEYEAYLIECFIGKSATGKLGN